MRQTRFIFLSAFMLAADIEANGSTKSLFGVGNSSDEETRSASVKTRTTVNLSAPAQRDGVDTPSAQQVLLFGDTTSSSDDETRGKSLREEGRGITAFTDGNLAAPGAESRRTTLEFTDVSDSISSNDLTAHQRWVLVCVCVASFLNLPSHSFKARNQGTVEPPLSRFIIATALEITDILHINRSHPDIRKSRGLAPGDDPLFWTQYNVAPWAGNYNTVCVKLLLFLRTLRCALFLPFLLTHSQ
jgi:hypothetical protein